jgi:hypothetical protein
MHYGFDPTAAFFGSFASSARLVTSLLPVYVGQKEFCNSSFQTRNLTSTVTIWRASPDRGRVYAL